MQPQITTNKAGQGRPISTQGSRPAPVGHGRQAASCSWGHRQCALISTHTPTNSSHRDKVSFHVKQRNEMNSSIPVKSKVRGAREKLKWTLLTLAAVLLLTRMKARQASTTVALKGRTDSHHQEQITPDVAKECAQKPETNDLSRTKSSYCSSPTSSAFQEPLQQQALSHISASGASLLRRFLLLARQRLQVCLAASLRARALPAHCQHPDGLRAPCLHTLHLPNEPLITAEGSVLHKIYYFSSCKKTKPTIPLFGVLLNCVFPPPQPPELGSQD